MKRILIVDDDVIIRITFEKLLKTGNYMIQQAKDVGDALRLMRDHIFDLVLLDLKLPTKGWEGGFQILKKKRGIKLNMSTPVIIVSGAKDDDPIKKRLTTEDNVYDVLLKPVDNDVLMTKIAEALGQSPEMMP